MSTFSIFFQYIKICHILSHFNYEFCDRNRKACIIVFKAVELRYPCKIFKIGGSFLKFEQKCVRFFDFFQYIWIRHILINFYDKLLSEFIVEYITIVVEIPWNYLNFRIVVETRKFLKNGKNWRKTDIWNRIYN